MMTGSVNAEILITGSSRALVHYDPRIIETTTGRTAFNIGRNGSQTDMQLAVLKAYLENNAKPKLVVHNLDLFSFVTSREIYDAAQYIPYLNSSALYTGARRVYPHAWKWKRLPLYGYLVEDMRFTWITGLKGFFGIHPPEDHFLGFLPRHSPWTGDFDKFVRENPTGVKFDIEAQGVKDLTELLDVCRKNTIPVLLVYSPEYSEMQNIERNRDEIFAIFRNLSEQFGISLWDYSDSPLSTHRNNFYNSQHLNANGARAFSTIFAQQLRSSGMLSGTALPQH
jgi:hypothetical protein